GRQLVVGPRLAPARASALDRTRLDPLAPDLEEAFRRGGHDVGAAEPHERHERRGTRLPKAAIERKGLPTPIGAQALGEVDLEDVAGADVVDGALDGPLVAPAWKRAPPGGEPPRSGLL